MSSTLRFRPIAAVPVLFVLWGAPVGCGGPASTPTSQSEMKPATPSSQARSKTPAASDIDIKVVKYDPWVEAVKAHQGKVVVVDIWADYCIPCKKEFPHLVELQRKYAKDGLVCMSVSVDEPDKKDACLTFLKARNATFPNFLMDEKPDLWQNKWDINAPPAVLVFSRDGKLARKFDNTDPDKQYTYADVEKFIQELLRPKG